MDGLGDGLGRRVIGVTPPVLEPPSSNSNGNSTSPPVVQLSNVSFVREGRTIVAPLDWQIEADERWLVLGANGSGKTSLVRICAMYEHPSSGEVRVFGEQLGRTDVRVLRRRIGYLSAAISAQSETGIEVV